MKPALTPTLLAGFALAVLWLVQTSRSTGEAAQQPVMTQQPAGSVLRALSAPGTDRRDDDLPSLAAAPDGSVWLAWLSYADRRDEIFLRQFRNGVWENRHFVPGTSGDLWAPQVGVGPEGKIWVVWSQSVDDNWDLFARALDPAAAEWGPLIRLTDHALPDINPRLASGGGRLAVAWQGFRGRNSNIFLRVLTNGEWQPEMPVTSRPANDWEPSLAVSPEGIVWIAYDSYENGNYDVFLTAIRDGQVFVSETPVARTARFEARSSIAVDKSGRVWIAWESGGPNWGKDTGFLIKDRQPGVVLGGDREVRIACYANGKLYAPESPLQDAFGYAADHAAFTHQPHVAVDANGAIWVAAKQHVVRGPDNQRKQALGRGSYEYAVTSWDGRSWAPAQPLPHSSGRLNRRTDSVAAPGGDLWLAWMTENRPADFPRRPLRSEIKVGTLGPAAATKSPRLRPLAFEPIETPQGHNDEPGDLRVLRAYHTVAAGRQVRIMRGDTHRHTELSWDEGGARDGSLQDFYRYMIDAAAMDFGAITDHQGGSYEYWWWYTQKMTDMHHVPGAYVAIHGFERSVHQPYGHRNVLYPTREGGVIPFFLKPGVRQYFLPAGPEGQFPGTAVPGTDVVANDTQLLRDEVRRRGGLTIPHTSGTRMGTDWRDSPDPAVEPVVEIFQGDRTSYEYPGAPLSVDPQKHATFISPGPGRLGAGNVPEGYVRQAWLKGYRIGVISSSDHLSTHFSYAMVYTPDATRRGILDAIRRRHTYGATDNILLEFRMGEHFMGEEFFAGQPIPMTVKVRGTNELAKVVVVRGDRIIYQTAPETRQVSFEFTDRDVHPGDGTKFYYVRVEQKDGQVAWASPIWVAF